MPEIQNVNIGETIASEWGNALRDRTIQRYASAAARATEHPAPAQGDLSYLSDSDSLWIYSGSAWVGVAFLSDEVDGQAINSLHTLTTSMTNATTLNLTIPGTWNTWKCVAWASYNAVVGTTGDAYLVQIRIDGSDAGMPKDASPPANRKEDGHVGGRRTGISTTGSRPIILRAQKSGSSTVQLTNITLYARAVRTS